MATDIKISVTQTGDDYIRVQVDTAESEDLDANALAYAVRRAVADSLRDQGLLVEPKSPVAAQPRFPVLILGDGESWELIPTDQTGPTVVAVTADELGRLREGEEPDNVVRDAVRFVPLAELLPERCL